MDPKPERTRFALADESALVAAGYRKYTAPSYEHGDAFYQRCIRDGAETRLYFINVTIFRFPEPHLGDRASAAVQFNTHGERPTFSVALLSRPATTIAEMEAFFADVYARMECEPYGD